MATFTGKEGSMKAGASDVGEIRSFDINTTGETLDDTVMGDAWRTKKAMHKTWTFSASLLIDPADVGQNAFATGAEVSCTFYPYAGATTAPVLGDLELIGSAIITERAIATTHEGLVELSISGEGNGALTEGTV